MKKAKRTKTPSETVDDMGRFVQLMGGWIELHGVPFSNYESRAPWVGSLAHFEAKDTGNIIMRYLFSWDSHSIIR